MVERGGADPLSRRLLCRRIHAVHTDGCPMIDGRALLLPGRGCIGGRPIIPPGFDIRGRCAGFLPEYALIPAIRGSRHISTGVRPYCPCTEAIAVNRGEPVSRRHRRQFDGEHRNVKGRYVDASIREAACGIPRGPGCLTGIRSRPQKTCPEGNRAAGCHRG